MSLMGWMFDRIGRRIQRLQNRVKYRAPFTAPTAWCEADARTRLQLQRHALGRSLRGSHRL